MLAAPISASAQPPSAAVEEIPTEASRPAGSTAAQASVMKAGKWAVMKPSW